MSDLDRDGGPFGQRRTFRPWKLRAGGPIVSRPLALDGTVYVNGLDHWLHAVDAASGAVRWSFRTSGQPPWPEFAVGFAPVHADGTVYIGARWRDRGGRSSITALSAATGEVRWRREFDGFIRDPGVDGGHVFVGCDDGWVYGLDAATGRQWWRYPERGVFRHMPWTSPFVADGLVICTAQERRAEGQGSSRGIIAVRPGRQKLEWTTAVHGTEVRYAADGGVIYLATDRGLLAAVSVANGEEVWAVQFELEPAERQDPGGVVLADRGPFDRGRRRDGVCGPRQRRDLGPAGRRRRLAVGGDVPQRHHG